jgi:hypothetical protein
MRKVFELQTVLEFLKTIRRLGKSAHNSDDASRERPGRFGVDNLQLLVILVEMDAPRLPAIQNIR